MKITTSQLCKLITPRVINGEKPSGQTFIERKEAKRILRIMDFENSHRFICKMKTINAAERAMNFVNFQGHSIEEMMIGFNSEIEN